MSACSQTKSAHISDLVLPELAGTVIKIIISEPQSIQMNLFDDWD